MISWMYQSWLFVSSIKCRPFLKPWLITAKTIKGARTSECPQTQLGYRYLIDTIITFCQNRGQSNSHPKSRSVWAIALYGAPPVHGRPFVDLQLIELLDMPRWLSEVTEGSRDPIDQCDWNRYLERRRILLSKAHWKGYFIEALEFNKVSYGWRLSVSGKSHFRPENGCS
jgi:hypothetical protein